MREPRFVRRRVSGETPTVNWVGLKEVMVRHVPDLGGRLVGGRCRDENKGSETQDGGVI